jgi:photosystem II stability/assembly factor-like uncharacterized protein
MVLIGTRKGLFTAHSRDDRRTWEIDPIHFANLEVYAVALDTRRDPPRILAGSGMGHWGFTLHHSDDLGRTWSEPETPALEFPKDTDTALMRAWHLRPAGPDEPDVVYAGVEPHALFRSDDGGISFSLVRGLWEHPHRTSWQPGGGGACLHTVLVHPDDPRRLLVAMSAAGVYRSSDGGASWEAANRGISVPHSPEEERFPEFGQCVHKVAMHPSRPERLFAQNHFGVYRSDDGASSWEAIETGLPSNFGFPIVVHPHKPDVVYNLPLEADGNRVPPDVRFRVYRSEDAGGSWHPLTEGLPEGPYYAAVLRDAMCTDAAERAGFYVGTRLGDVFATRDEGESWSTLASRLPDVLTVRAAVLA